MKMIFICLLVLSVLPAQARIISPATTFSFPPAPTVAVTSTSNPGLDGNYTVDANAVGNITAIVSGIAADQGFPGGASTFVYVDAGGQPHTFPSTTEFVAFGAAIRNYVYALQMVSMGQQSALPSVPLTIP